MAVGASGANAEILQFGLFITGGIFLVLRIEYCVDSDTKILCSKRRYSLRSVTAVINL